MGCNSAKYRSVCTCQNQQRRTHLHDAAPNSVKINGPNFLRHSECPATRTDENERCRRSEETDNVSKKNGSRRLNRRTASHCPPGLGIDHPSPKRGKRTISMSQTPLQCCSTKKRSHKKTSWTNTKNLRLLMRIG